LVVSPRVGWITKVAATLRVSKAVGVGAVVIYSALWSPLTHFVCQ